jgi:hypothetical protein
MECWALECWAMKTENLKRPKGEQPASLEQPVRRLGLLGYPTGTVSVPVSSSVWDGRDVSRSRLNLFWGRGGEWYRRGGLR